MSRRRRPPAAGPRSHHDRRPKFDRRALPEDPLVWVGYALSGIGLVLFLSVFVTHALNFGNLHHFEARARSAMLRGVAGMALMIAGGAIRHFAGDGRRLDDPPAPPPERSSVSQGTVVKVRCPWCGSLNAEAAAACGECGGRL